ncbi:MAG: hypothetical protein CL610_02400 [Anaerolineaceae bacterium]|nr:hypothetical protein [Anaerolineaceae bacterium]
MMRTARSLLPVIFMLLIHCYIRTNDITLFEPYVDEGYHIERGARVWNFDVHPGQFAHGKVLVYFWLGLFDGPPSTNLAAARLAIALISTITAATIYILGRTLRNHLAGLIALFIYAFVPFAFFFERMALADPFAAMFAILVVWRSLIFANHPTTRQGIIIGLLLGLATLAKLTVVTLPLITLAAVALTYDWQLGMRGAVRTYLWGLGVAAAVVVLMWLPMLIPAYFAHIQGDPFILVNDFNIQRTDSFAPPNALVYVANILPSIAEFTSVALLLLAALAFIIGLIRQQWQALFLGIWIVSISIPVVALARVITIRYLMPVTAPLVLIIAFALEQIWWRARLRPLAAGAAMLWLVSYAIPFRASDPMQLTLTGSNQFDFQSGFFTADEAVHETATILSSINEPGIVYATREACHLLYFYSDPFTLRCLDDDPIPTFGQTMLDELRPGQPAYLVISNYYGPFHYGLDWLNSEEIVLEHAPQFQGVGYEFRLWKIWLADQQDETEPVTDSS